VPDEKKQNYPGNSHKSRVTVEKTVKVSTETPEEGKKERKRPEAVIKGAVVGKKDKTLGQKIRATFTGDDAKGLMEYLLLDVAIPAFKSLVVEATEQGIHRLMYGSEVRPRSSGSRNFTSYNRMSSPSSSSYRREEPRSMSQRDRATHNFENIVLDTIRDAEEVLESLRNIADEYDGIATVSDLYDLVNMSPEWTDEKWGWDNLSRAQVRRVPGGYMVDLPKPIYLK